jgi:hypothetical protein
MKDSLRNNVYATCRFAYVSLYREEFVIIHKAIHKTAISMVPIDRHNNGANRPP